MERSKGIYKPIKVLFGTPIYQTAVNTCWHLQGYKSQIAVMMEFLRLQQEHQIPPHITAEDMSNLLVQESKRTLREQLWEFKLDDLEETEAKPLLKLVWAVNVINKMRDVEFEAQMLLNFPEATPPNFRTPKLLNLAKKYTEVLKEKQQETETSRLHTAEEVVIEVVPRVLQGFWQLPPQPLLNMASQRLSILCTSVTKATLDKVSKTPTAMESQAMFSRSIRDDVVQTILTEIREQYPLDILLKSLSNFAPVLLTTIAAVAKKHICKIFQPQMNSKLEPSEEPHAEPPTLSDVQASEETPSQNLPTSEVKPIEEPPAEPPTLSDVRASEETPSQNLPTSEVKPIEEPHAEPPTLSDVQASEETPSQSLPTSEVKPSEEPLADPPTLSDIQASEETPSQSLPTSEVEPSEEPPVESPNLIEVQPSEETPSQNLAMSEIRSSEEPSSERLPVSEADVPLFSVTQNSEEHKSKKKKKKSFFQKLLRTLCCCCVSPTATD